MRANTSRHDRRRRGATANHRDLVPGTGIGHAVAIAIATLLLEGAPLMAAPPSPDRAGALNGTVQSATGQTLPNYRVQIRDMQTGRITATGTSNAEGGFSFTGLPPAGYVVEAVRPTGEIVGVNVVGPAAANGSVRMTVPAAAPAALAPAAGPASAAIVAHAAAAAGITGTVVSAGRNLASPSR